MTREVRLSEVEPGHRYRLTFARPPLAGSRKKVFEGEILAAFWGELPFQTDAGVIRIERYSVVRACLVS